MSDMVISVRAAEKDLGGFSVRRALPTIQKRAISYFVFFDHMGPASFAGDKGMDVRPHPHIALATVTYLFDGKIIHRDSLGNKQVIEAGDVNWMTAGRGIVHSERTPKGEAFVMHGIQIWVALPKEKEDIEASFRHYAKDQLPEFKKDGASLKLILGEFEGKRSPVQIESQIFYLDAHLSKAKSLELSFAKDHEAGVYIVSGTLEIKDVDIFNQGTLIALKANQSYTLVATEDCHFVFFGGEPMPEPRHMWWNFVSVSQEKIEKAKLAWSNQRMGQVPEETEFIPLPNS